MNKWNAVLEIDKPDYDVPKLYITDESDEVFDTVIRMCPHIKDVKESIFPQVWVDRYGNAIASEEDYFYTRAYGKNEQFFIEEYKPLMLETIRKIKG